MRLNLAIRYGLLTLAGAVVATVGVSTGAFPLSWKELFDILSGGSHPQAEIVWRIRLPRLALAALTGGLLTLSGFLMQAVVRNPLADPYIMGVSAGAGLAVNALLLGLAPVAAFSLLTLPLFAAAGGMASLMLVLAIGGRGLQEDSARLLIAGVASSSLATALVGVMLFFAPRDSQIRNMIFWTFGSFDRATPEAVAICAVMLALGLSAGKLLALRLDILLLGDASATSLGMSVPRFRLSILVWASLLAGASVAFAGPVGFVGLMGPHFARALFGASHRKAILPGVVLGAVFVAAADVAARIALPPAGLPIGIVTALLGAPFFIFLLFRQQRGHF